MCRPIPNTDCACYSPAKLHYRGISAAEDLRIQQGDDHDKLLEEMEEIFTDPDGMMSTLEKYLSPYEAKVLLCEAFQVILLIKRQDTCMFALIHLCLFPQRFPLNLIDHACVYKSACI